MKHGLLFASTLWLSFPAFAADIPHDGFVDLTVVIAAPGLNVTQVSYAFAAAHYVETGVEAPVWNVVDDCGLKRQGDGSVGCVINNFDIRDLIKAPQGGKNYYAFAIYRVKDQFNPSAYLCNSDGVAKSVFNYDNLRIVNPGFNPNPLATLTISDCQAVNP